MENPYLLPQPAVISFSGGRTSGYLLAKIIEAFGGKLPDDVFVTFANTGKEREETLEFVRECSERWGVRIRWLEYCRDTRKPLVIYRGGIPNIGQHSRRVVTFETASRNGEPFEELIAVKADFRREAKNAGPILPNPVQRFCSGELKRRVMERYLASIGYKTYTTAVGLRWDEPDRALRLTRVCTKNRTYVCPLYDAHVSEREVLVFWKQQPFDLKLQVHPELGTYEGNCDLCFLKRTAKIKRLIDERPESVEWWAKLEEQTGTTFRRDRPSYRELASGRQPLALCDDKDETVCMCTD